MTARKSRSAAWPLAAALLGPVAVGAGLGVFLQTTAPQTRVYAAASPGLLAGVAGLLAAAVLGAVVLARRRAAAARKAAEAAVRDAVARAAADRLRFLMRLDHELKNPLTAIHAGLANASASAGHADTSADTALASVSAQVNRITRLLGDLRKMAELETREIEAAPVDLPGLLHEVAETADESGRAIQVTVPRAPWPLPLIQGDRDLLFIALQNLVANAVKFSAPGDTVEVRASEDGSWVLLEVADTGAGIPEDEIGEVWAELARGRAARSVPGTGIGLALVRVIVARHGGRAAIRSRDGQGTVVSVSLPVHGRPESAPAVAEPRHHRDPRGTVPA